MASSAPFPAASTPLPSIEPVQPRDGPIMMGASTLRLRPIKRQRTDDSDAPLAARPMRASVAQPVRASVAPSPAVPKTERDVFFDALESADQFPGMKRVIESPDDLERMELKQCFAILHECGQATDPTASLVSTRHSIEGFLEAIFNEWSSAMTDLPRPELDLSVGEDVVAGRICMVPEQHTNISHCLASDVCTAEVSAVATYSTTPPMLRLEYTMTDPFSGRGESICPITRSDIHWVTTDWARALRCRLALKITAKMHRHNKRLAVWQARRLIKGWAKGSLCIGVEAGKLGFLKEDAAKKALLGLADRQ